MEVSNGEAPAEAQADAESAGEAAESAARDALIAELESEMDGGEPSGKPVKVTRSKPGKAEAEATDDGEAEADDADPGDEDAPGLEQSTEEFRERVKGLVEAGDIRKLEEELGLEKGALKVDGAKFRHLRQRAEKAAKAEASAQAARAQTNTLLTQARQEYGPMVQAKHLFNSGTPQGVQQAGRFVEKHFGVPLAQFVDTIIKAGRGEAAPQRGPDPEVAELKQTVLQLKQSLEQRQNAESEKVQSERHVATIRGKLTGSPIAKLPDAAQLVYARLKGSYDSTIDGYKLTLKDAISAVAEDPATKWRLHELRQRSATTTPPSAGRAPGKATSNGNGKHVAPRAKGGKMTEEQEKQALIVELEAAARKEERAQRYGKH
jgi:hypothetical protein